jgi:hypothetical protein
MQFAEQLAYIGSGLIAYQTRWPQMCVKAISLRFVRCLPQATRVCWRPREPHLGATKERVALIQFGEFRPVHVHRMTAMCEQ